MKVMIYIGEGKDFFGYKPVKFDFKKGTKVRLASGKFAISVLVEELGNSSFVLLKRAFSECKKMRNASIEDKVLFLLEVVKKYSGEEGNNIAKEMIEKQERLLSDKVEGILEEIENNI